MKPWLKWTIALLVLALLAAGVLRTLSARKDKQVALAAQQTAQKSEVAIELTEADLLPVKVVDLALNVAISGSVKAVNSAMVKARVPGELQNVTVREGDSVQAGRYWVASTRLSPRLACARPTNKPKPPRRRLISRNAPMTTTWLWSLRALSPAPHWPHRRPIWLRLKPITLRRNPRPMWLPRV